MSSSRIIDFHAHAFPEGIPVPETLLQMRRSARSWMRPLTHSLHRTQTLLRHLPSPLREGLDQLTGLAPIAGLMMESSLDDLIESMEDNEIDQVLLIAQPPWIPNDFVIQAAKKDPRILPAVNIPKEAARPGAALKTLAKKGAKALKIHPAADAEGPDSKRYRALLATASELDLPVIIHTGCIRSHLLFKDPGQSRAELFAPWFGEFSSTTFVLAHMNFHEPNIALDLVQEYPNVYVDTSWQPAETIAEAARRVGANRILFGSDWPLLGNNLAVGLTRIEDCVETGMITEEDSRLILGENAARILKL